MNADEGGRAWKLGDDISNDQMIPMSLVYQYDPAVLRRHLLAEVRPELPQAAVAGDWLVAGERFAHGSNHSHPFIALAALKMGIICASMPRGAFRLAIFMGVPVLIDDAGFHATVTDGDRLSVDPASGRVDNRTQGGSFQLKPLSPFLQGIIAAGGGMGYVRQYAAETGQAETAVPGRN